MNGRRARAPNTEVLYANNIWRSLVSFKGIKQGKKHIPAREAVVLSDRESRGREPALHIRAWDIRHVPMRGRRVTWCSGRAGFLRVKRSAGPDRGRP